MKFSPGVASVLGCCSWGRAWDGFCGCVAVVHFCVLPVTAFAFASVCDPATAAPSLLRH